MSEMDELFLRAKAAKAGIAQASTQKKNDALAAMADALEEQLDTILSVNARDVENARGRISDVMLDRLKLTEARVRAMAQGLRDVRALPDPVGRVFDSFTREDGLKIEKVAVPLGVVAIIYESRPNVTADAAALCVKSGNVCLLRPGRDAHASADAIVSALSLGLERAGLSPDTVLLVPGLDRSSATALMTAKGSVDLLIPRGGKGLISACVENATVPCIETGTGICHLYVEKTAELPAALRVIENAKTSRPSVCNAAEVLLVDRAILKEFLPLLREALVEKRQSASLPPVELRLCPECAQIIPGTAAGENDFDTEFLDYVLAVRAVSGVKEAVAHIAAHSTGHSEAILTEDPAAADYFTQNVDSAAVYVNASTRFTDGGEFGLGCEMGISTQKLHARGPMGLRELTTYKYVIRGCGHVR